MKRKILYYPLVCLSIFVLPPAYADSNGTPFNLLQQQINSLQEQINNIQLKPGPQGPAGPQGPVGPPGAPGSVDRSRFQLVGYSEQTFNGESGINNLNAACHTDFPGSRMCTSVEIMDTVNPPVSRPNTDSAWVRPVIVGTSDDTATDASGIPASFRNSLSCYGWSSVYFEAKALTIFFSGAERNASFELNRCNIPINVSCCALVD